MAPPVAKWVAPLVRLRCERGGLCAVAVREGGGYVQLSGVYGKKRKLKKNFTTTNPRRREREREREIFNLLENAGSCFGIIFSALGFGKPTRENFL